MSKGIKYDLQETDELIAVLFTSIETAKKNRDKQGVFTWILGLSVGYWILKMALPQNVWVGGRFAVIMRGYHEKNNPGGCVAAHNVRSLCR